MRAKSLKARASDLGPRQQLCLDISEPVIAEVSFQEVLNSRVQANAIDGSPIQPSWAPPGRDRIGWQTICSKAMTHAWSFLHSKYKISTTKRLRVSETISLGDKRFVAIVIVEGKEFLIGGGVAGMSLLAPLGSTAGFSSDSKHKFADGGGVL